MVVKRKRGDEWVPVNSSSMSAEASIPPFQKLASTSEAAQPPQKQAKASAEDDFGSSSSQKAAPRRSRRILTTAKDMTASGSMPLPPAGAVKASSSSRAKAPAKGGKKKKVQEIPAPTFETQEASRIGAIAVHDVTLASVKMPPPPAGAVGPPSSSQTKAPARKGRKKKDPENADAPEKRLARFRVSCPQNILERLERVRTQTFFMVDRRREDGELKEEFSVLGSTGNVYTILVDKIPKCDCPDARMGNHCKHILFVMTKVLQVPQSTGYWYQKALLTSELESIFASAPAAPNAVTNHRVQEAYARATGQAPSTPVASSSKKRLPGEDDDCPICYETMYQVAEAKLVFCDECGNALHTTCFSQWRATSSRSGKALTCVWCRSKWDTGNANANAGPARKGGYLNLAGAAGLSPVRDTSSYYHGPRRGQRVGPGSLP